MDEVPKEIVVSLSQTQQNFSDVLQIGTIVALFFISGSVLNMVCFRFLVDPDFALSVELKQEFFHDALLLWSSRSPQLLFLAHWFIAQLPHD